MGFSVYFMALGIVTVICMASLAGIFQKAERPPLLALVPIYNLYLLCQICAISPWWLVCYLNPTKIPVGLITTVLINNRLAKSFGKGIGFMAGLIFLPFVFYPLLAFGDAAYLLKTAKPSPADEMTDKAA